MSLSYFRSFCCRKGDPFQGLKLGSCLTLRNEFFKETYVLTKQEILLGRGPQAESSRVREPRRTAAIWLQPQGFMVMGLGSQLSLANHSESESFLVVQALFSQMDAREKDSGRWLGISF